MSTAFLGLGSNLGDRRQQLEQAITALKNLGAIQSVSSFYETDPQNNARQPQFLNCALQLNTILTPYQLLDRIHAIEIEFGRVRAERFGPRTIDIDILLYHDLVMKKHDLAIPHPRLHERAFVLVPLLEIAPHLSHPLLEKRLAALLAELPEQGIQKLG